MGKIFDQMKGGTFVSHTFVCVMATIILIPCVFLRDLKVFTGQKRLLITVYSSFILNGGHLRSFQVAKGHI